LKRQKRLLQPRRCQIFQHLPQLIENLGLRIMLFE